jgi:hypothetical protein
MEAVTIALYAKNLAIIFNRAAAFMGKRKDLEHQYYVPDVKVLY